MNYTTNTTDVLHKPEDANIILLLQILLLTIKTNNIVLHSIGCHLLTVICLKGKSSVQYILVKNLSVIETAISIVGIFITASEMIYHEDGAKTSNEFDKYLTIIRNTGLAFIYFMAMIYITIDRLLEIYLDLRYHLFCNEGNARRLLVATWCVGVLLVVGFTIPTVLITKFEYLEPFYKYILTPVSFSFIILAVTSYVSIFVRFRRTRMHPAHTNKMTKKQVSCFYAFRNSRFFLAVLLITSFILLVELPAFVFMLYHFVYKSRKYVIGAIFVLMYDISNIVDAVIYIFVQREVRNEFLRWMGRRFPCLNVKDQRASEISLATISDRSFQRSDA